MYQVGYADVVVSHNLAKYLLIEAKPPGTLHPGRRTLEAALAQARRYADEQSIRTIAATDGRYFYAADIGDGGLTDRACLDLTAAVPPADLWYLSVPGIYRPCHPHDLSVPICAEIAASAPVDPGDLPVHPKYRLPAGCFADVPDANRPRTWKLPYRRADGAVDIQRLPKAIQAILSNYRGAKVGAFLKGPSATS